MSLLRFLVLQTFFVIAVPVSATPILSLTAANGTDLSSLVVGQSVQFHVVLAELSAGDKLDSLSATVRFGDELLSLSNIVRGEILPDPLDDPLDFVSSDDAGVADAAFLTLGAASSHHISANGVFYSFDVTIENPGEGDIRFDFVSATAFNSADPNSPSLLDISFGGPLHFVAAVPEPDSVVLLLLATSSLFAIARRKYTNS